MVFLKTLTAEYLRLLGITTKEKDPRILDINEAPTKEETANGFETVDETKKTGGFRGDIAVQMSGRLSKIHPCQVLHFKMDAQKLKEIANKQGGTVTAYILSKMFLAGKIATEKLDGKYIIQLPVDLRKFYPHKTLLNFSMHCSVGLDISQINQNANFVKDITEQIKAKAAKLPMDEMANSTKKMVKSLALFPLFIKLSGVKLVYHFLASAIFSNILSSLGVITMPKELSDHIESMDFFLGNSSIHRTSCTLLTFGNTATFSISKNTTDPTFEERIYDLLREDGLEVKVERSPIYGKWNNLSNGKKVLTKKTPSNDRLSLGFYRRRFYKHHNECMA